MLSNTFLYFKFNDVFKTFQTEFLKRTIKERNCARLTARIAVFTDDVRMCVYRGNRQLFRDQISKSGRVQVGARSDHSVAWQAGELPRHVRHYVN